MQIKKIICLVFICQVNTGLSSTSFKKVAVKFLDEQKWQAQQKFTKENYVNLRKMLLSYGVNNFFNDLVDSGIISQQGKILPRERNPLSQLLEFGYIKIEDKVIDPYYSLEELKDKKMFAEQEKYLLAGNKPELDKAWLENDSKASMSKWHKFLIPRNNKWRTSNILTFGMSEKAEAITLKFLKEDIELLKDMERVAIIYANKIGVCEENLMLCFHVFPKNSIPTLHLHMLDCRDLGPSYNLNKHKNLLLADAIEVLEGELKDACEI